MAYYVAIIPTTEEVDDTEYSYDTLVTEQDLQDEAICPLSCKVIYDISRWTGT